VDKKDGEDVRQKTALTVSLKAVRKSLKGREKAVGEGNRCGGRLVEESRKGRWLVGSAISSTRRLGKVFYPIGMKGKKEGLTELVE
jgi:hypothetical protein